MSKQEVGKRLCLKDNSECPEGQEKKKIQKQIKFNLDYSNHFAPLSSDIDMDNVNTFMYTLLSKGSEVFGSQLARDIKSGLNSSFTHPFNTNEDKEIPDEGLFCRSLNLKQELNIELKITPTSRHKKTKADFMKVLALLNSRANVTFIDRMFAEQLKLLLIKLDRLIWVFNVDRTQNSA